ncbi:hypothetical protein BMW22_34695 (plasmid) [Rhizobium leguminosarum]|uniref:Uncharacterized protein n=1 Tax=Rhizobium leguminosarum TaxID=384 RepID=A0A1B1CPA9_RHILE|nr:hypothetical protein BA011_36560 [Rhizobium leguminosarum]API56649.1 hypothetical protein BMW22_34695 [Rhizobium leguminosarum]
MMSCRRATAAAFDIVRDQRKGRSPHGSSALFASAAKSMWIQDTDFVFAFGALTDARAMRPEE